jgi:fructose-bisphosphate aldolase, class I
MDNIANMESLQTEKCRLHNKQLFVAIDHGLSFPGMPGLEQPFPLLKAIAENDLVNGMIASAGIYRQAEKMHIDLSHLMRLITVDYVCVNQIKGEQVLTERAAILTPEEAASYSPDGYKLFLNIYDDNRLLLDNVRDFSRFASAGKRLGIQALAEVLFYNNSSFSDPKKQAAELKRGCRIAMELGADMLKIPMIRDHEAIAEIIEQTGLPVYILGGGDDHTAFLKEIKRISRLPISGLMVGRNIWQGENMTRRIKEISQALQASEDSASIDAKDQEDAYAEPSGTIALS